MTECNDDKAQENVAREESTHEESMHNKTTQEKAAQKKSAQEITGSELRKAEEEALKKRLALRVTAPGHRYRRNPDSRHGRSIHQPVHRRKSHRRLAHVLGSCRIHHLHRD